MRGMPRRCGRPASTVQTRNRSIRRVRSPDSGSRTNAQVALNSGMVTSPMAPAMARPGMSRSAGLSRDTPAAAPSPEAAARVGGHDIPGGEVLILGQDRACALALHVEGVVAVPTAPAIAHLDEPWPHGRWRRAAEQGPGLDDPGCRHEGAPRKG